MNWKQGDLAIITHKSGQRGTAVRVASNQWVCCGPEKMGYTCHWDGDEAIADVRPALLIDPDDRDQAERFARTYSDRYLHTAGWEVKTPQARKMITDAVQETFRAMLQPPAPPCPAPLSINGRDIPCDGKAFHKGAHSNLEHGAVWGKPS